MRAIIRPIHVFSLLAAAAFTALTLVHTATAQNAATPPYMASITSSEANVLSGADASYDPFGKVKKDELVKVIGEKNGFARIVTYGPAFESFYGYIKYPKAETGRFRLNADGRTGLTLGITEIFAPNLTAGGNPAESWKPLVRLQAETPVNVIETLTTDKENVHKVRLPENAEGWIVLTQLRKATTTEIAGWEAAIAVAKNPKPVEPPKPAPAQTPTPVPNTPSTDTTTTPEQAVEVTETIPAEEVPAVEIAAPVEPAKPVEPPAPKPKTIEQKYQDLEAAYQLLRRQETADAEIQPLRELYLSLAAEAPARSPIVRLCDARAEQLAIWIDVQERMYRVAEVKARVSSAQQDAELARQGVIARADYVAVGRLESSIIFDGQRLPRFLRLQDPGTGRTIAYLEPDDNYNLVSLLGHLLGVVGEKHFDDGLRLNVVEARRIDILGPQGERTPAPRLEADPSATNRRSSGALIGEQTTHQPPVDIDFPR